MKSAEQESSPMFSLKDGRIFISSSREAITTYFSKHEIRIPERLLSEQRFRKNLGCFVTLRVNDSEKSLRGCIGFPEPVYSLSRALSEAAVEAAVHDPRFEPVLPSELDSLLIEVSVLTVPTLITVESQMELPSKVVIGKDGLIIRWSLGSGLLLPQVATEQNWTAEEFLTQLSMKGGAPPDQWLVPGTQIFKFQAQIFSEEEPNGNVRIEG